MTKIKICGITNKKDALEAVRLGADMLGFIFYKNSGRFVTPAVVEDIINELPPSTGTVGVFVDEKTEEVTKIAEDAGLKMLQFHGVETPAYCSRFKADYKVIKAFRLKDKDDLKSVNGYDADFYLFDTYAADKPGGTGRTFDLKILKDFEILKPFILSGGLTPENVGLGIRELAPYGVDVSTGVEDSPGKKSSLAMIRFIENVRKADL